MDRRSFLSWMGVGWVAASLPVALAACSGGSNQTTQPPAAPADTSAAAPAPGPIGTVADLDKQGFLADKTRSAIVIRDPKNPSQVVAFSSKCTHEGCDVSWQGGEFVCPCHGAKYTADGSVTKPPAKQPLAPLSAKIEGDRVVLQG